MFTTWGWLKRFLQWIWPLAKKVYTTEVTKMVLIFDVMASVPGGKAITRIPNVEVVTK